MTSQPSRNTSETSSCKSRSAHRREKKRSMFSSHSHEYLSIYTACELYSHSRPSFTTIGKVVSLFNLVMLMQSIVWLCQSTFVQHDLGAWSNSNLESDSALEPYGYQISAVILSSHLSISYFSLYRRLLVMTLLTCLLKNVRFSSDKQLRRREDSSWLCQASSTRTTGRTRCKNRSLTPLGNVNYS